MSTIAGVHASSTFGTLTSLIGDNAVIRQRLDRLNEQVSTGQVARDYAGLGAGAALSLDLRPALGSLRTWQTNIDAAALRLNVTQSAMTGIQKIATDLRAQLNNLNGVAGAQIDVIAANARTALAQVGTLLNSQANGTYVFAGEDSANPPVPSPDAITGTGFFTQIAAAVAGLSANGAAATAATTLTIAQSNTPGVSPFSTYLSQPAGAIAQPRIEVGPGQTAGTGLLASGNIAITSQGGATTGSYMRDLMRALATVGSLASAQSGDPGFADLVQDVRTSLTDATTAMAGEVGVLGDRQATLESLRTQMDETATALTRQVASVEDVDMAATLSRLSLMQTQMQASYQLIAGFNGLSLTKFLGSS